MELTADRLERLFPGGVRCAVSEAAFDAGDLLPEERRHVAGAIGRRVSEFATGRVLARGLLSELGFDPAPIPVGPGRAPLWPNGVVGSISHAGGLCAVCVARSDVVRSVGLDLEGGREVSPRIFPKILTEEERAALADLPATARQDRARLVFCAKEALYKCQHPLTTTWLGFQDATVEILGPDSFRARVRHPGLRARGLDIWHGRYLEAGGFTAAAVCAE